VGAYCRAPLDAARREASGTVKALVDRDGNSDC
jgi:hypothetical protein